jgi:hypothetical protein
MLRYTGSRRDVFEPLVDHNLILVVAHARIEQAAPEQPHIGPNADRTPLLDDHFGLLGPCRRQRLRDIDLQAQALAIVGAYVTMETTQRRSYKQQGLAAYPALATRRSRGLPISFSIQLVWTHVD